MTKNFTVITMTAGFCQRQRHARLSIPGDQRELLLQLTHPESSSLITTDLALGLGLVAGAHGRIMAAQDDGASISEELIEEKNSRRRIPLRVRWPAASFGSGRPLVIFSHDLGGTMNGGALDGQS